VRKVASFSGKYACCLIALKHSKPILSHFFASHQLLVEELLLLDDLDLAVRLGVRHAHQRIALLDHIVAQHARALLDAPAEYPRGAGQAHACTAELSQYKPI
jgi:hypothetical protein